MSKIWRFILALFRAIGTTLSWLRHALLTVVTALVLLAVLGQFNPPPFNLPDSAVLKIAPTGLLVDQLSYSDPFGELMTPDAAPTETLLHELIAVIDHAANNPKISAIQLETDRLAGADIAKIIELGNALLRFRDSGKPVVASADYFDQYQYLLASHANTIFLHQFGGVEISGIQARRSYFADLLGRLKIDIHLFRAGEFKDAVEPLISSTMSDNSRAQLQRLVDQRWSLYRDRVTANRELPQGALDELIDNFAETLRAANGDAAAVALNSGLVDGIGNRSQLKVSRDNWLVQYQSEQELSDGVKSGFSRVTVEMSRYARWMRAQQTANSSQADIIIYTASGQILDGQHSAGTIGGDSSAQHLKEIFEQTILSERPTAIVVRIDSPGGSAFASEIIREKIDFLRLHNIPVVISMGSTAASGGYWIATGAEYVVAQAATLTGSIGVFGLVPTFDRSLAAVGIDYAQVSSSPTAASYHPQQSLSKTAATIFQSSVDGLYSRFLKHVSESRELSIERANEIAGGQVWSGRDALELGLVDQIGGLNVAIEAAAKLLGAESYSTEHFEPELTPWEQFAVAISQQLQSLSAQFQLGGQLLQWLPAQTQTALTTNSLEQLQRSFNDPQGRYLLCTLCE
ncbi:MAG: signal peptide peptidase SppA [Porticoccaceae bacterium]